MALTDNIISYWKLDESSGNAADSTPTGNTLTNVNTVAFVPAKIANGGDFERSSAEYFQITDAAQTGLDFSDALTFSCWMNAESFDAGTEATFISKRLGAGNQRSYHWKIGVAGSGLGLLWYTDGSSIGGNLSVAWTPSTSTYYHVAVTKSGTTVKFYVDGAQLGTDQTGSNATIFNGTAPFDVGAFSTDAQYFDGILDEVGVWNRALSGAEIAQLYNSGTGLTYPFAAAGPATLESWNTVAKASIETMNTANLNTIESWNTVA